MRKLLATLILLPSLLAGQDTLHVLRDAVPHGNAPGLVIAVFTVRPETALDTVGYRLEDGLVVPETREVLTGWSLSPMDTLGVRYAGQARIWVNWSLADTVRFAGSLPTDREVIMTERLIAGEFGAAPPDSADIVADSLWRLSP